MADFQDIKKILRTMESNDGQNINHPIITEGIHKGTSAMGEYGLMPKTAQDLIKNSTDPLDQIIKSSDPTQVEEILKGNPDKYNQLVDQQIDNITDRTSDPKEAAVLWNSGQNLPMDRVKRHIAEDPNNFTGRTEDAIDRNHPISEENIYDYLQNLKDYNDWKNRKQDRLYNPIDLPTNGVNLKLRKP